MTRIAAAALLLCFVLQCVTSMVQKSATIDEQVYVAAGYAALATGDFRLKRDAPPLVSTLAGLVLHGARWLGAPIAFPHGSDSWQRSLAGDGGAEYTVAGEFFRAGGNDGVRMLRLARLPVVGLGLVLGMFVFAWARRLFGDGGGLLALLVFAVDPNMVAHAGIVSTDVALATFFLASHYYLYRLLAEPTSRAVAPLALCVALTVAAKFTGLLVVPSLGLLVTVCLLRPPARFRGGRVAGARAYRLHLARLLPVVALACAAATWVVLALLYRRWDPFVPYADGLVRIYENVQGDYEYYLLGEFRRGTWPHYYLVATLVKTPEATLALALLALWPWGGRPYPWSAVLFLLLPVVLVHLVCTQDQANFGLRRVLLTYPFLFVLIGRLPAVWWDERGLPRRWWQGGTLAALIGLAVATAWRIHPYQLAYFNALCGGPADGHACLDDSNIDWGQDLPGLRRYLRAHGIDSIRWFSYAIEPPAAYGIESTPVTAGEELSHPGPYVYAIGVHNLVRMKLYARLSGDERLDWLARHQPSGRVGHSIYLYDFRPSGAAVVPEGRR